MKFLSLLSTLAVFGTVIALPNPMPNADLGNLEPLEKREAKDKSGKSQMVLQCEGTTIPQGAGSQGESGGGVGYFKKNMKMLANGKEVTPSKCDEQNSFCSKCTFEGEGLSSATDVTGCWNPPGGKRGCSVEFQYNGHQYKQGDDKCGTQGGFQPFSFDLSAVCYFDI
ncbi:hypothetical protein N7492_002030 [Penicillium capsulatum]|uniref:Uncharacterized protein n=1 Tax=Penicillium capsulatum TaxID=69766 RepID=A0A9W9IHV2_9EURO|nr:hypothetical protein N7492_002030 [Penicillium capsulatum]KAJ6123351.1 hypothetical protein N7512_005816 [Penicillium capsulatum]